MLIRVQETASVTFYACPIMRMNRSPFTMHVAVLDACPLLIKGRMGSSGYIFCREISYAHMITSLYFYPSHPCIVDGAIEQK